jgi:hypothetical protein
MSDAETRSLRAAQTLSARRRSQGARCLYFTDYTLTGQQSASPFWKSHAGRPRCRYWALVRCSPSLFHQSHFDWEHERFSDAGPAHCQAIPHASPSVTSSLPESRHFSFTNYALSSTGILLGSGCQRSVARNFYRGDKYGSQRTRTVAKTTRSFASRDWPSGTPPLS